MVMSGRKRSSPLPRPTIVATLKPRWRYETKRRAFFTGAGKSFAPRGQLPRASRIEYLVPRLAGLRPADLSAAERRVRRVIQIVLPSGFEPAEYLETIAGWPSVADVHIGPMPALPRL